MSRICARSRRPSRAPPASTRRSPRRCAALQAGETPEVTGQAIADALLGLDGMDSPTVLAFDETGRAVVLGRGGRRIGPVEVGGTLPASRSAYLLEHARAGAWTERWVPRPEDGEYGIRFAATGLKATVYAPVSYTHL